MRLIYPYNLPKLPYKFDDFSPYLSEWTMRNHFEKVHKDYIDRLNSLLSNKPNLKNMKLAMLLTQAKGHLFDVSSQHFNHVLWWFSLKPPQDNNLPTPSVLKLIVRDFGSFENWKKDFEEKGSKLFGNGYIWLCLEDGKLINSTTKNSGIPNFVANKIPLLVCDVWEHAYFFDYTTDKNKYIHSFFKCVNWQMVQVRLQKEDKIFSLY